MKRIASVIFALSTVWFVIYTKDLGTFAGTYRVTEDGMVHICAIKEKRWFGWKDLQERPCKMITVPREQIIKIEHQNF